MDFETPTTMMDKFIFGREKKRERVTGDKHVIFKWYVTSIKKTWQKTK